MIAIGDTRIAIEREPFRPGGQEQWKTPGPSIPACTDVVQCKKLIASRRNSSISGGNYELQQPAPASLLTRGRRFAVQASHQETPLMTEHSLWRFSRAFHLAINEQQFAELADLIDDDVEWAIYGPIDLFNFFGSRRGKPAVMDVLRQIAGNFRIHRFDRESIMLGVDSAASMLRFSLTALDSEKPISVRIAHFAQFRSGLLTSLRVLVDSFDLVEQTVGYPIHLPSMAAE
jgi:ketosteroid isomerase-like protein